MFNDHNFTDHNNFMETREAVIALVRAEHRGQLQWQAEGIPAEWRGTLQRHIRAVVVNLPWGTEAFEGERWEMRLSRKNPVPILLFVDAVRKMANPAGVPDFFEAGMQLAVVETPENDGTLVRRQGTVSDVQVLENGSFGIIFVDDVENRVLRLESGHLPRFVNGPMRISRLHQTGDTWHAYNGKRLVQLYRV